MSKTGKGKNAASSTQATAEAVGQRPSARALAFAKRHPVLTVAGAIAVGAALSAFVPRRASRKLLGKALAVAEAAGAAGILSDLKAGETTKEMGRAARRRVSILGDKAEDAREATARQLERYGLAALTAASTLGKATAARASQLGDAASDRARQVRELAGDVRSRITH